MNEASAGLTERNGERGSELRGRAEERIPPQAEVHAPALLRAARGLRAWSGPPGVLRKREEVPQRESSGAQAGPRARDVLQHQQARRRQAQAHDRAVHPRRELRCGRRERGGPGRVVPRAARAALQE